MLNVVDAKLSCLLCWSMNELRSFHFTADFIFRRAWYWYLEIGSCVLLSSGCVYDRVQKLYIFGLLVEYAA